MQIKLSLDFSVETCNPAGCLFTVLMYIFICLFVCLFIYYGCSAIKIFNRVIKKINRDEWINVLIAR